jgi:hypothetical protein
MQDRNFYKYLLVTVLETLLKYYIVLLQENVSRNAVLLLILETLETLKSSFVLSFFKFWLN